MYDSIDSIIDAYPNLEMMNRLKLNYFIYDTHQLLDNQVDKALSQYKKKKECVFQVCINQNWLPKQIEEITKALSIYGTVILYTEESLGYSRTFSGAPPDEFSGNLSPTFYKKEGSLKYSWLINTFKILKPAIEMEKVFIVPSYMSSNTTDLEDPYQPTFFNQGPNYSFESFAEKCDALGILHESDNLKQVIRRPAPTFKDSINWEITEDTSKYWSYLFKDLSLPYIKECNLIDVLEFQKDEPELFRLFNKKIANNIKSLRVQSSENKIENLVIETYEGFNEIQNIFQEKLPYLRKVAGVSIVTLGLSALLFSSVDMEIIKFIAQAMAEASISTMIPIPIKYYTNKSKIKSNNYYIPYRVTNILNE